MVDPKINQNFSHLDPPGAKLRERLLRQHLGDPVLLDEHPMKRIRLSA